MIQKKFKVFINIDNHGKLEMMKKSLRNEYIVRCYFILESVHMELRLIIWFEVPYFVKQQF